MKKRSISLIIGLMSVALLGVMAMQLYYLKQSYTLKSQLFDQSVNQALSKVAAKIEKYEAYDFLKKRVQEDDEEVLREKQLFLAKAKEANKPRKERKNQGMSHKDRYAYLLRKEQRIADSIFAVRDSILRSKYPYVVAVNEPEDEDQIQIDVKIDVAEFEDQFGGVHQRAITRVVPRVNAEAKAVSERIDSIKRYLVLDPVKGPQIVTSVKPKIKTLSESAIRELERSKKEHASKVKKYLDSVRLVKKKGMLEDLATEMQEVNIPIQKRINLIFLDSMLRAEFQNQGVNIDYAYQVTSARKDSLIFIKASNNAYTFEPYNTYKTVLFPNDMIRDAGMLMVTFPQKNSVIMSNLGAMMISSASLLLVLLFCFGFTIHLILRQKKISEMKTDFINNMTHEFKTPVATIMIASEALKDPELTEDRSRINRLAGIIYDENVRLGNHIERVLNIAKIDKGDLKLDFKPVEMNELIAAITDSMELQFQKKEAVVDLQLDAAHACVKGDELHLSNVIFNLIDNALKYSNDHPKITITTQNSGKNLVIRVRDKGIGMSKDQLSKIFEQFYRIPTGNLHDVKGFGLGLSYVSNIVKRHHGNIRVKSEKDKGSEFEIIFPTQ
ncbi:sensor histidine kinase KdpD [Pedobacter sp. SYSU D00535]|uniref:sensor histidine kinase n=1 Tax=Pedobacter sp. SYSU D00535 TaxID=2810308 RepID=UPI001A9757F2|nr:HAMP domain-containing sensor histidine kinase [Pedobacter sp. SYSU D00535]